MAILLRWTSAVTRRGAQRSGAAPQALDGDRPAWPLSFRSVAQSNIDLANETAGHPTNKAEFSHRLALLALHDVYGKPIAVWSGPLYRDAHRDGDRMVIAFNHATGLHAGSKAFRELHRNTIE